MRILGVDPGTLRVGYGCLELGGDSIAPRAVDVPVAHRVRNLVRMSKARVAVVEAGTLRLGRSADPVPVRLHRLADELGRLLASLQPDELALEEAFFGKSVQAALRLGESRGVILAEAARRGLRISQFPPARVKRSVTGNGSASKELVARMVQQALQLTGAPAPDTTDALAVGLCCAEGKRTIHPTAG